MLRYLSESTSVLFCFAALLVAGCDRAEPSPQPSWRAGDPAYVPFDVGEIVVSGDNRYVSITDKADLKDRKYLIDLSTGEHRQLEGANLTLLPISKGHEFLLYSRNSASPVQLLDGFESIKSFNLGTVGGGWWNPKNGSVIFGTAWAPQEREGFHEVGILNLASGSFPKIQLRQPTELLAVCPETGNFYADGADNPDEYALNGNFLRSLPTKAAVFSLDCRYGLSFAALARHGPAPWGIFEAESGKLVMEFPYSEESMSWLGEWNPRQSNLLLVHTARSNQFRIEIIDLASRKTRKVFDQEMVVWSGDGNSVVSLKDHHIVFEPIHLADPL